MTHCSTGRRCYCASTAYEKYSRYAVDTPHTPKNLHLRCGFAKHAQWSRRGAPGIRHVRYVRHQILNMLKKIAVRSPSINYAVGALWMRSADVKGTEHTWSVRSPYANDRSTCANVRSSYAIDRHASAGYWHHCETNVKLMLCVPYQFAHTKQI